MDYLYFVMTYIYIYIYIYKYDTRYDTQYDMNDSIFRTCLQGQITHALVLDYHLYIDDIK